VLLSLGAHRHDVHATRVQSEESIREIRGSPDQASTRVLLPSGAATSRQSVVNDVRAQGLARVV
jgi:hypothetical protein